MSSDFDFAIAGTTPFAACLAGMLAKTHGARVCLVGTLPHRLRIHRGFDLGLAPATQPHALKLLRSCLPEALQMVGDIGDGKSFERIDPLFSATTQAGAEMLALMRNVADSYGYRSEPLPTGAHTIASYQFRNVVRVLRRPLTVAMSDWLSDAGVILFPTDYAQLNIGRGGGAQIEADGRKFSVERLALAGDNALLRHAEPGEVDRFFRRTPTSAILAEPTTPIGGRVINIVDQDLVIHQRPNGALDCVGAGNLASLIEKVRAQLPTGASLRLAGQATFPRLHSRDGAPILTLLKPKGTMAISGFGTSGLFLIPAIARWLMDRATPDETTYFGALASSKANQRQVAADFTPAFAEVSP